MKKFKKYTVDFTNVNYYLEMHAVIWKSLDFPDYYGNNFDALYDCLTDLENVEINIFPPTEDGAIYQKFLRVLKAADRNNDSLKINLL